jgi:isopentenyldiphosphate isomerase
MSELCDIYDINGIKTGKSIYREKALKADQYLLAANIWIFNKFSQVLIQKRAEIKII